jgi:hypothetical protein
LRREEIAREKAKSFLFPRGGGDAFAADDY